MEQCYPWLMVSDDETQPEWTFYSLLEKRSNDREIPEIGESTCVQFTGCNGWLVLVRMDRRNQGTWQIDLLQIASLEKIKLPDVEPVEDFQPYYTFLMTAPPTDPNCTLLLFSGTKPRAVIWRPGHENWSELRYDDNMCENLIKARNDRNYRTRSRALIYPSFCGNVIYGIVRSSDKDARTHVVVLDIAGDKLTARTLAQGPNKYGRISVKKCVLGEDKYLVESEDEIFCIEIFSSPWGSKELKSLDVYKLDRAAKTWTAVSSIDDRVFFLSQARCFSCSTRNSDAVRGNCIHFVRGKEAYTYDMETHSIHHYFPSPDGPFYGWCLTPLFVML